MVGRNRKAAAWTAAAMLMVVACGPEEAPSRSNWDVAEGEGDQTRYEDGSDVVIAPGDTDTNYVVTGDPEGIEGCAQVGDDCVAIDEAKGRYCGEEGAKADILLDENGEVIEAVCYPPPESGVPIEEVTVSEDGTTALPQSANGAVITFDEETNGEPLEGDVALDGERVVIFGNGVDETILDGDLSVASNNSRVRGVTITGDVSYARNSNNSKLTFCAIHGSLQVPSNGFTAANCRVFGDVDVSGNEATLVNVGVQGQWSVSAGATCQGCYSFTDEDGDLLVSDEEVGDPLECGGGGPPEEEEEGRVGGSPGE